MSGSRRQWHGYKPEGRFNWAVFGSALDFQPSESWIRPLQSSVFCGKCVFCCSSCLVLSGHCMVGVLHDPFVAICVWWYRTHVLLCVILSSRQGWRAWIITPSWWPSRGSWYESWWTPTGRGESGVWRAGAGVGCDGATWEEPGLCKGFHSLCVNAFAT